MLSTALRRGLVAARPLTQRPAFARVSTRSFVSMSQKKLHQYIDEPTIIPNKLEDGTVYLDMAQAGQGWGW